MLKQSLKVQIVLASVCLILVLLFLAKQWHKTQFSSVKWNSNNLTLPVRSPSNQVRSLMLENLITDRLHFGMKRAEVEKLIGLGTPLSANESRYFAGVRPYEVEPDHIVVRYSDVNTLESIQSFFQLPGKNNAGQEKVFAPRSLAKEEDEMN